MGNLAFIEILFWAAVAVFLVIRLRSTLGSKTGYEDDSQQDDFMTARRKREEEKLKAKQGKTDFSFHDPKQPPAESDQNKVISLAEQRDEKPAARPESYKPELTSLHHGKPRKQPLDVESPLARGLASIQTKDRSFNSEEFLQGATTAFDMTLMAFAAGDRTTLKNLLSAEVFNNFNVAIDAREKANQTHETVLVGILDAELVEAELQGSTALVSVSFVSEQVNVTRDSGDNVVDGDPNTVSRIADIWTFARDVRSNNPNWELVETRTPN
ncbi:Tim44/TimA family putative adaptor protein [Kiloniella sp. b19]|uniref:Tim44/TimA family putative adaptor protein n=1 Tax=Kiloniella sp. GXU_MW_B19 TaxID=3141326 RepID=UPI0031D4B473